MGRVLKYLVYLIVLGAAGLAVYALVADLPPPQEPLVETVTPPWN